MSASSSSPPPSWEMLVADCLRDLPATCFKTPELEAEMETSLFDLRRRLVDRLARDHAPGGDEEDDAQSLRWEDNLRDSLPPLIVTPGPFAPLFSAWRSAIVSVLGLLAGSALAQGLLRGGTPPLGGALPLLCGVLGVMITLWLHHKLLEAAGKGRVRFLGEELSWTTFRRWFRWGVAGLTVLALLRDFFTARDPISDILAAVGAFLAQGQVLGLFTTIYGALAWVALFAICLARPLLLDKNAFGERLALAVGNWWAGASRAAVALGENAALRGEDKAKQWRQAGLDLYSFAAELPPTRREWLEDRLRLLGLEAPRDNGMLIWEHSLRDRYEALGHLEPGERCYVDQPPLLEQGRLLRKGVVRKVRR